MASEEILMPDFRRIRTVVLTACAIFMTAGSARAVDFKFSGSIRPRFEAVGEGAQGLKAGQDAAHTTMQTRINVKAIVDDNTSVFVQIQDVRTWGGETATTAPPSITQTGTGSSGNLDFHEAYLTLNNLLDAGLNLKIGRQEMVFDEHRLIGNIGWIQQGQSFDAARAGFRLGELSLTAFFAKTLAKDTHPTLKSDTLPSSVSSFESSFSGLRATYSLGGKDRITPYLYYAISPSRTGAGPDSSPDVAKNITYTGLYIVKHFGKIRARFDGAYEFGEKDSTTDIRAFMLTASLGTKLDIANGANISLWVDYLSGDDGTDATTDNTFDTPYATNHKFYGHIDKFLNIPTGGLADYIVKTWVKPTAKIKLVADGHIFRSPEAAVSDLGSEIDLQARYALGKHTGLAVGYSRFFKGGAGAVGVGGDPSLDSNWAFAMITVKF
jgi:hypothetical protein